MKYTLSVLVENQPGVLSKVAGLFSRRGFNIDSLAVGVTEDPKISRMTIVVNGDEHIVEQVEKQLNKVIPVIKVKTLNTAGDFLSCELNLIKVSANAQQRTELLQLANLFDRPGHRCFPHDHDPALCGNTPKRGKPDDAPSALWGEGSGPHRHHCH